MPLKVAFYSDALTARRRYGLSRYAWELFEHLQLSPDISLLPISAHAPLEPEMLQRLACQHGYRRLPGRRKHLAACWSLLGAPALDHWIPEADLVHCVELDYRVPTRKPLIVTVHDLGPLTHPGLFGQSHPWLLKTALRAAVRHAETIICVSQATADAVQVCSKTSLGDRLCVVPEGVSAEFFKFVPDQCLRRTGPFIRQRHPFFLWTGSLNPRKNLVRVIAAFEQIAPLVPHHLVLAGGLGWDADGILGRLRSSACRHRLHLPGRVSDLELRGLYQRASAFVFPSLMEGFGLPILEAMAAECPVITSNLSSMPEVAGDAAFLVHPERTGEIAAAMHCLATDDTFSARLRHLGRARAEEFRWETCAGAVARIYARACRAPRLRRHASLSVAVRGAASAQHPQPVPIK